MTRYLISFPSGAMDHIPAEEFPAVGEAAHAVVQEAMDAGVLVFGGGLAEDVDPVMVAGDGTFTVGTYPQTTEFNGGFTVVDVPAEFKDAVEAARHAVVEAAVEHDEELIEKYLGGEELTVEEIRRAIRKATIAMAITPVLCGASFKNKGVQALLDAVLDFLPSPVEVPAIQGHLPHHDETFEDRQVADDAPFAALVTRATHALTIPPGSDSKVLYVCAQWTNDKGECGPVGDWAVTSIAA